jgi:hypothetical protein
MRWNKQTRIPAVIEAPSGVNDSLFFLFYVSFLLEIFCYGLSLAIAKGLDRQVGWQLASNELMSKWSIGLARTFSRLPVPRDRF